MLSWCKSYAFAVQEQCFPDVRAMLSRRKSYDFRMQKLSVGYQRGRNKKDFYAFACIFRSSPTRIHNIIRIFAPDNTYGRHAHREHSPRSGGAGSETVKLRAHEAQCHSACGQRLRFQIVSSFSEIVRKREILLIFSGHFENAN